MPFREVSAMDERREFVGLATMSGANVRLLCRRFGISPTTGYKWLGRYRTAGAAGVLEHSRRPRSSPARTPDEVEAAVLTLRERSNNAWGGRKIRTAMQRAGAPSVPAASTITAILRRHDRLGQATAHPGPHQRFERAAANELWQLDFKGHFAIGHGRCHPLTALDDHSRFSLVLAACGDEQTPTARGALERAFRHYGLPAAMLMDGGPPWGDPGGDPFTVFTVWLMRLGIRVLHGRPHHPQTQGKEERFHRSLKAEVLNGRSFRDLAECQATFDDWRRVYNHERPHQAIGMAVPAERYRVSGRALPEPLPPIEYADGDIVRKVQDGGFISFQNRAIRLSRAFRGQPVALRPTREDGVFSVYYCAHGIATLDLRNPTPVARGFVDIATAMSTNPPAQQQQQAATQ